MQSGEIPNRNIKFGNHIAVQAFLLFQIVDHKNGDLPAIADLLSPGKSCQFNRSTQHFPIGLIQQHFP